MNGLIKINKDNALEIFTSEKLDKYLSDIAESARNFTANIETPNGREKIISVAYSVAKEKTKLDDFGKELVSEWKRNSKLVDSSRKKSRDFLDNLRDEIRKPVTDWEIAEKARLQAKVDAREFEEAWGAAHSEDDLFNRQREVERKEAEFEAQEKARIEVARKAKEEKERVERENKIALEARVQAEKEAAEKIEAEKRARIEAELNAKIEKGEAARQAEFDKQAAIQGEREAVAAKELEKQEAERVEREKAEKKAANVEHQKRINNAALKSFKAEGFGEEEAKRIIGLIANCKIKNITINY